MRGGLYNQLAIPLYSSPMEQAVTIALAYLQIRDGCTLVERIERIIDPLTSSRLKKRLFWRRSHAHDATRGSLGTRSRD